MSSKRVHLVIDLAIQDGRFEDFATTVRLMTAATAKEPGALGYEWYVSSDRRSCRLLETYADSQAVTAHLAGPAVKVHVPQLLASVTLARFEVYGSPDAASAATLSSFGAKIYPHWHGLPPRE